jgi:abequosyltransferase
VSEGINLSICIATFNRGGYIVETLNSIVAQLREGVELLIVDGASTDDTSERVREFRSRYPNVRYFREPTNSGIDQDFDKAVSYAGGRYVWLMTDDDIMIDGAVSRVCAALESPHDLIIVNSEVRNADLTKVLCQRSIDIRDDIEYPGGGQDAFMVDMARALTFIGSVIVRRDLWLARERSAYYGSLFVHVGVIFQKPPIGRVRVLAEPVLRIRYGVAMWTPRSFEVWMYKWPRLIWSFDGYTEQARAAITLREPWRRPMKLFHFRSKNAYSIEEYRKHFAQLRGWYRAWAFAIAVFPATIANLLSIGYVAVRSTQNRIPLFDLVNAQRTVWLRRFLRRTFRL